MSQDELERLKNDFAYFVKKMQPMIKQQNEEIERLRVAMIEAKDSFSKCIYVGTPPVHPVIADKIGSITGRSSDLLIVDDCPPPPVFPKIKPPKLHCVFNADFSGIEARIASQLSILKKDFGIDVGLPYKKQQANRWANKWDHKVKRR